MKIQQLNNVLRVNVHIGGCVHSQGFESKVMLIFPQGKGVCSEELYTPLSFNIGLEWH